MKSLLISVFIFISGFCFSQELNFGGFIGTGPIATDYQLFLTLGGTIEFRPKKSIISFNLDPTIHFYDHKAAFTAPLYFKFNIGNKFRVCPTIGTFLRTTGTYSSYGWSGGLILEYFINDHLLVFLKGDFMKDYYKTIVPTHYGNGEINGSESSVWVSIGIKKNILR